jgi:hypothetical protein
MLGCKNIKAIVLEGKLGFRKERLCTNIFILKQLIEKHKEFNHELYFLFMDYVKAFDRVDREKLWKIIY